MVDAPDDPRSDALQVLIEQERQLISRLEARQDSADGTAAAAITGVLALAALVATAIQTVKHIDKTLAVIVVFALAIVCLVAVAARFMAGLHHVDDHATYGAVSMSSRSAEYRQALEELRECGPTEQLNPILVRQRVLNVCRVRFNDAQSSAESKERWAVGASVLLAIAVLLTGILALPTIAA